MLDSVAELSASITAVGLVARPPYANPRRAAQLVRARLRFPEYAVPVHAASAGDDGSLWLALDPAGASMRRWIILDPTLEPLGRVVIPRNSNIRWHNAGAVWAVLLDANDVPWLVRYGIR
jgi:hypothetical protein